MTVTELTENAKRTLNAGESQPRVWADNEFELAASVLQARGELSHRVMNDDSLRSLLQQTYTVPLDASGVGDPLAAIGSVTGNTGEILQEGIKYGAVIDADGNILQPLTHYGDFIRPQSTVYAYYTLKDRKIHTRAKDIPVNGPADIQSVIGPLTIPASFTPQEVDDFPPELHDMLVATLCDVVTRKNSNADAG